MNITFGIQKRQWQLIFLVLSIPLLLNAVAIWQDIGTTSIRKMWNGTYPDPFLNIPYNPLPEILLKLVLLISALGPMAWIIVFISNRAFFRRQRSIIKLFETLLLASLIAKIFEIAAGFFLPLIWLPKFHDYLLGMPVSNFTLHWSRWLILPITLIILFLAMSLSGTEKKDIRSATDPLIH